MKIPSLTKVVIDGHKNCLHWLFKDLVTITKSLYVKRDDLKT